MTSNQMAGAKLQSLAAPAPSAADSGIHKPGLIQAFTTHGLIQAFTRLG